MGMRQVQLQKLSKHALYSISSILSYNAGNMETETWERVNREAIQLLSIPIINANYLYSVEMAGVSHLD